MRRNVDYLSSFLIHHKRNGALTAVENAFEIDCGYSVKFLLRNIGKKLLLRHACVIDKHRNAPEALGGVCKHFFHFLKIGNFRP